MHCAPSRDLGWSMATTALLDSLGGIEPALDSPLHAHAAPPPSPPSLSLPSFRTRRFIPQLSPSTTTPRSAPRRVFSPGRTDNSPRSQSRFEDDHPEGQMVMLARRDIKRSVRRTKRIRTRKSLAGGLDARNHHLDHRMLAHSFLFFHLPSNLIYRCLNEYTSIYIHTVPSLW